MGTLNAKFGKKLAKYGTFDFSACYNCGNCTAVCSLTDQEESFPRNMVRYSVLGLEDEIKSSLKPWLCYYCGDCSAYCPQEAFPGELMMSLRRWLTSRYDWTRLAGLFYRSVIWNIIAFLLIAAGVITYAFHVNFSLEHVMHVGHLFEIVAIAAVFAIILMPNIVRMWWFTIAKSGEKIPVKAYLISLRELFLHMFTQKRTLDCEKHTFRWLEHLILVIGYLTLLFTTVFLDWFSARNKIVIVFGYIVSGLVFIVTFHFVFNRIIKSKEVSRFSHHSDWFFVIWLFFMGITAFVVRLYIDINIIEDNLWLYLVHLIILVQWAVIIVPFGKWTHFLYRSFAMYFKKVLTSANQ
ncbi:MAG: 4Fe-4S dicluster domain-containing protein [Bacteroidales bacterium]|nr:4Fe-4S dicluster domain-containing protein [Bacteroidales bacterium]